MRPEFVKVIGFPYKLVDSPFHAFRVFSPDLRHYIDWSHNIENFQIRSSENIHFDNIEVDREIFTMKKAKNIWNIKNQLKYIRWVDN